MTSQSKIEAISKYALAERRGSFKVFIFLILLIPLVLIIAWNELNTFTKTWNDYISPLIGVVTLFVAILVWVAELMEEWRNDLPKKLTVIFRYDGKEVMRCNHAELFSEADIRPLGQQIGRQMAGGGKIDLDFAAPSVKQTKKEVSSDNETGFFMDYEVVFELTNLPELLKDLKPNEYRLWEPPFPEKPLVVSRSPS